MRIEVRNTQIRLPVLPILAVGVIAVLLWMAMKLGRVDASEIGVLINNVTGTVSVRTEPGSFFYNGWTTDLHTIDKTLHTLRMRADTGQEVRIKTVDGPDVRLDVEVNYKLLLDEKTIVQRVVPESGVRKVSDEREEMGRGRQANEPETIEGYQAKWIRDYSRSIIRYVFGTLTTEEFYDSRKRDEKAREAERELNKALNVHGIEITKVVPDRFRFYEAYETRIQEKTGAIQEKEKQEELAKEATESQKRQELEANKQAEVEIAKIKGVLQRAKIETEGQVVKLTKEAEGYAYKTKIDAEAAFYQAERQAKGILAAAKAEAEGLSNLVKALDGDGGRNLVLRALAEALGRARIEGAPYATSSLIQKVAIEGAAGAAASQEAKR